MSSIGNANITLEIRTASEGSNLSNSEKNDVGAITTTLNDVLGNVVTIDNYLIATRTIVDLIFPLEADIKSVAFASGNTNSGDAKLFMIHAPNTLNREIITAMPCPWLDIQPILLDCNNDGLYLEPVDERNHLRFIVDHAAGSRLVFWVNITAEIFQR